MPLSIVGAESFAFEMRGGEFYTGVKDGRILRYNPPTSTFTDLPSSHQGGIISNS
ncbi:hypothetical protein Patl1_19008 [Pistacia atlantica]|uniref:Uncharacterized protein n=1 Tax=Pistacia atlantica TaxID=434234 RepID=A0ACC1BYN0_9ROSI|nr:hypothetical protein Patl1_19008 [Pistacia atlantica]